MLVKGAPEKKAAETMGSKSIQIDLMLCGIDN